MLLLKAGDYEKAVGKLDRAAGRITSGYMIPENAAPLYYLGLALVSAGKDEEAYDHFCNGGAGS
jgi:hypothetical protein